MGILSEIQLDLRRILLTVPGLPAQKVWEGEAYEPAAGVPYVQERLDPVGATTETLGAMTGGQVAERGIYAVDLWRPPSMLGPDGTESLFALRNLADAVRAIFWHGRAVGPAGTSGWVISADAPSILKSPGWLHAPVRILFTVRRPTLVS